MLREQDDRKTKPKLGLETRCDSNVTDDLLRFLNATFAFGN